MKKPLLLLIPALFLITGCGEKSEPNPDHQHVFGDAWVFDLTNHWHECECGERKDSSPHTFSDDWKKDALKHWHECECGNKIDNENHIDIDNNLICDVCGQTLPMPPCPDNNHVDANEDMVCDICGYPVIYPHIESVSANYTAPFYLKVGEERRLHLEISPSKGVRSIEKIFTWDNPNKDVASLTPNENDSLYATIKGVKEGKAVVKATNTYNPELTRSITANVIDYDDENMYLWEYKSDDRKQFGYVNEEGKKAGVTDGTAILNGVEWDFHRSSALALNSQKGGLAFGKGFDQTTLRSYPETTVKLTTKNERKVKKIVIETASANGLANINVKVGETEVLNRLTPSSSAEAVGSVSTRELDDLTGDISIEFTTPDFDETRVADEDYKRPGAVIIKSIWITYDENPFVPEYTFDFEEMYNDPNSILSANVKSTTSKSFSFIKNYYKISFDKIRKSDNSENEYFETNSNITITLLKPEKVISSITFEWKVFDDNKNEYTVLSSPFGGEPFIDSLSKDNTGSLSENFDSNNVYCIRLNAGTNKYIGLKSISLNAKDGIHAAIDKISYEDQSSLAKVNYSEGESFDPNGLPNLTVSFINEDVEPVEVTNNFVNFYDGPSYENPSDHSGASKVLLGGTTYVIAELNGFTTKIEGLTVETKTIECTKVKSIDDLVSGKYLFVIPSTKQYWKGSSDSIKTADGVGSLGVEELTDTLVLPSMIGDDAFSIEKSENIFKITVQGKKVGITAKGALSIASSPNNVNWSASILDGIIDFTIGETDSLKHLTFSSKFDVGDASSNNISLYKIAD